MLVLVSRTSALLAETLPIFLQLLPLVWYCQIPSKVAVFSEMAIPANESPSGSEKVAA